MIKRKIVVPVVLCMLLVVAFASAASAAPPKVRPLTGGCNITVTHNYSAGEHDGGVLVVQSFIQEIKSSDGTSCYSFRAGFGVQRLNPNYAEVWERQTGFNWWPDGTPVSGSGAVSYTHFVAPNGTWSYYFGPWVTLTVGRIQGYGLAWDQYGNPILAYTPQYTIV